MDLNAQKQKFSVAFVHAVAAVARCRLATYDVDFDSVDCTIASDGAHGTIRRPKLDVQLKCTSQDVVGETHLNFDLILKNYNDLRIEDPEVPRILVVVIVPTDVDNWLEQSENEMIIRHCGYWLNLRGFKPTTNPTTVTVHLPREQMFTPDALKRIMTRINNREAL